MRTNASKFPKILHFFEKSDDGWSLPPLSRNRRRLPRLLEISGMFARVVAGARGILPRGNQ